MASTKPGESSADPADTAQALRDEIEQARKRLGDTVDQLAAKADVKKQARAGAARLGERGRAAVARARGQAKKTAQGQARHALDQSARTAREQRVPLAAAAGTLAAALAVLIIWKRRKQS